MSNGPPPAGFFSILQDKRCAVLALGAEVYRRWAVAGDLGSSKSRLADVAKVLVPSSQVPSKAKSAKHAKASIGGCRPVYKSFRMLRTTLSL